MGFNKELHANLDKEMAEMEMRERQEDEARRVIDIMEEGGEREAEEEKVEKVEKVEEKETEEDDEYSDDDFEAEDD